MHSGQKTVKPKRGQGMRNRIDGESCQSEEALISNWKKDFEDRRKVYICSLLSELEDWLNQEGEQASALFKHHFLDALFSLGYCTVEEIAERTGFNRDTLVSWKNSSDYTGWVAGEIGFMKLQLIFSAYTGAGGLWHIFRSQQESNTDGKAVADQVVNPDCLVGTPRAPVNISFSDRLSELPGWLKLPARLRSSLLAIEVRTVSDLADLAAFKAKNPILTKGLRWKEVLLKVPGIGPASLGLLLRYLDGLGFRLAGRS